MRKLVGIIFAVTMFLTTPIIALAQTYDEGFSYTYKGNVDPATAEGFLGVTTIVFLVCFCLIMLAWLGVSIWVYKDAKKKNINNPAVWGLITYFLTLLGLLLYLFIGRKSTPNKVIETPKTTEVPTMSPDGK